MTVPGCSECPDFFPMPVDGEPANIQMDLDSRQRPLSRRRLRRKILQAESPTPHQVDFGKGYYAVQTYSDTPRLSPHPDSAG